MARPVKLTSNKLVLKLKFDEENTALISGFNPSIMKTLLSCSEFSPLKVMRETIDSERYSEIKI